jgi:hypothetical protein
MASETLARRFRYVFRSQRGKKRRRKHWRTWIKPEPFRPSTARLLENNDEANTDDNYKADDKYTDDAAGKTNDDNVHDDMYSAADERCSAFLVSFLEGTTDAHDTCEGMMNAYTAAGKTRRP